MADETPTPFEEAAEYEQGIAGEAAKIREEFGDGDSSWVAGDLFADLYPLLCNSIPQGYIQQIPKIEGKPYESTGIRSAQVLVDRLNNVLTPLWWRESVEYDKEGTLCRVTIEIGPADAPLMDRTAWGGVRANNIGNTFQGSWTNAFKRCCARIGIGAEVYRGTVDLDPDVNEEIAGNAQGQGSAGAEIAKKLVDNAWKIGPAKSRIRLAASHLHGEDVGDCDTKAKATEALAKLSLEHARELDNWIRNKGEEKK